MSTESNAGTNTFAIDVIRKRVQAIAEEMFDSISRLAFSISIQEWSDYSTGVMTRDGRAIGTSRRSVPALTGAISRTTQLVLENHISPDELEPGDAILTNDSWIGGGHLPDMIIITPIFYGDELVAFTGAIGHVGDVGGAMGAWATDLQQVYEEGLIIPPVKLYEQNKRNEKITAIIRNNVRVPDQIVGDIEALRSGTTLGADRVQELTEDYGVEQFDQAGEEILDRSEQALRSNIDNLQDGTYKQETILTIDDYELSIPVAATIDGSEIHIDFSGASDEINAGINVPYTNTRAVTAYILQAMVAPEIENTDGVFEPLTITAPKGTIVNASRPISTDGRTIVYQRFEDRLIQAIGEVVPDRRVASSGKFQVISFNGVDPDGQEFVAANLGIAPFPARPNKDGMNTGLFPTNARNVPIETFEKYSPLLVEKKGLVANSEGAGQYRSGLSEEFVVRNPTDNDINVSITSDNADRAPFGIEGGTEGTTSMVESITKGEEINPNGRYVMNPGEVLRFQTASAGGFGDPAERDPERVKQDHRRGYISASRANTGYGTDVDGENNK
jgi:N-methylhydantoinase B